MSYGLAHRFCLLYGLRTQELPLGDITQLLRNIPQFQRWVPRGSLTHLLAIHLNRYRSTYLMPSEPSTKWLHDAPTYVSFCRISLGSGLKKSKI